MTVAVFDADLELKAVSAAVTSTTSTTGKNINIRYMQPISWVINVTALDAATGDETYVFTLEVSDLVGGTYTVIATHTWPRAMSTGKVAIPVSAHQAVFQDADSDWVRVTATLAVAGSSITYTSYLTKATTNMGTGVRVGDTNRWT